MDNRDKILVLLSDEDFQNVQSGILLIEGLALSKTELTALIGADEDDIFGDSGLVEALFLDSDAEEIIFKLNEIPHGVYIAIWLLKHMRDAQDSAFELTKLNLNQMDWEYDKIEKLPENISELDSLVELDLYGNGLEDLPQSIGLLQNLEVLQLSDNRLFQLPEEIQNLTQLRYLGLELNELEEFCGDFSQMTALQTLDIRHNRYLSCLPKNIPCTIINNDPMLSYPPDSPTLRANLELCERLWEPICRMSWLEVIHLTGEFEYCLTEVPDMLGGLSKLQVLNLSKNKLSTIPRTIANLSELKVLDLRENPLTEECKAWLQKEFVGVEVLI